MRVASLPLCGLGFLSLAVSGAGLHAQQLKKAQTEVRPIEQVSIAPVTYGWDELLQIQASFPKLTPVIDQAQFLSIEPPTGEVSTRGAFVLRPEESSGIEKLGPCSGFTSEPPIGIDFDSELDVPDAMAFSYIPPDIGGGVGTRHLMTMLNNQVLIQDRTGGSPVAIDTNVFWSPVGATPATPTIVYPRVYFDAHISRWIASARNGITSTGSTSIFFALSQTDDPTGLWDYYAFLADPGATSFADWVLLGYNSSWITITANMFTTPSGASFLGAKMWTIDATSLPPGGPISAFTFAAGFMSAVHGSGGSSPHPARTFDGDPTLYMINNGFTSGGVYLLQVTRITGVGTPVVSGIPGSPFGGTTSFCFVSTNFSATSRSMSQIGDARFISAFSNRIASVAVRNGKIWVANAAGSPGPSTNAAPTSQAVIWHQLDPTLPFPGAPAAPGTMVEQSGAITNGANTMSMYPSLAVNCADDVLIGFANGDATRSPRACYTFRLGTDALGFMGPIGELKAGESVYWKNFGVGTTAQYGRYSASAVDPNDDKTLWTLQEYADQRVATPGVDNDSRWGTRWGRFGDCEDLPLITADPLDVVACIGDTVPFSVTASSFSPLTYQWRRNGIDILGATSSTYTIASAVSGDGGSYDVVVCGCGETISQAAILTFAGPVISAQPVTINVAPGNPAAFSVTATGAGTLTYQWLFNGNPIPLATSSTYSIASVVIADWGAYSCIVEDSCGPVTSDTALLRPRVETGKHLPASLSLHVFEDPESQDACVGSTAVLSVTAYPAGVTYLWRKNGSVIVPNETNSTLSISPISALDAGNYDVLVTLGSQTVNSADATLSVIDLAVITAQPTPASTTKNVGQSIVYSVTATGDGPITYQWLFRPNGQGSVFSDIPGETGSTLTLDPLTQANSGRYRCIVSNPCGGVASSVVQLVVLP